MPTRLLVGHDDPIASPALLQGWEDNADTMTVERLERVGHFVPEEAPHEVVSAVASMFETDERTRSSWSVPGRETTRFLRSEAKETSRMIDGGLASPSKS